jgi:glyoxylase-like metal-dependent hydrolase (beta-lactamase superfamily II)
VHADHVGWDTHLADGAWIPTFTHARHLYTAAELEFARVTADHPQMAHLYRDSIRPILDAGLADEVADDADLGDGLRLEPSPGHTPGHVSLWVESAGERALVTGDFMHHPVQFAEPDWAETGDADVDVARATRHRMVRLAAQSGALVLGTHFASRPAGRVAADGDVWRFVPEPA